ncbi:hypothetical protein GPJ56_010777 [Histomonas meleagridis]|uniref:uncharacterized protein n=1 Tax=Histomonas meleagridis TaxID=135588 RepID=UPI00355A17B9|nr:hypothetical protein GPJ56_010777 [Histomonas meleagridis]KAH0801114.1 hypothetical protein GO595_006149 [Histomonas meleagridis]
MGQFPSYLVNTSDFSWKVDVPTPQIEIIGPEAVNQFNPVYVDPSFFDGAKFHVMQNTYFLPDCVFLQNNSYVLLSHACHPRYWDGLYQQPDKITYNLTYYKKVICIGHQHTSDYGHWFLEVFPVYVALPQNLLHESIIIVPEEREYIYQCLETLGIKREQVIAGHNDAFFADTFYTVSYKFCGDLVPYFIDNFRKFFVKTFDLDHVKPHRFVMYNRKNTSRSIGNFKEVMDMVHTKFPNIPWEEGEIPKNIEDQAKYFNEIKFFFGIHGSALAGAIYMQPGTAVVEMQMEQWLLSFLYLSRYTSKIMVSGRDPKISWSGLEPCTLDLNYTETLIRRALEKLGAI